MARKLLVVVDPQIDFTSPDGALSVKDAHLAFDNINKLLNSDEFVLKVITQDWHPANHVSFASTHGAEMFTKKQTKQGTKFITQMMWPTHCVAGTKGAEITPMIESERANLIVRKGTDPYRENYSALEYAYEGESTFNDNTPFYEMFTNLDIDEVYVCGFATDYCVAQTARSFDEIVPTFIVSDACKAVDENNAIKVLADLGIETVYTAGTA